MGIARALVHRPALVLADEPTGNLDPVLSTEILGLFQRFQQVGVTVVIATHDVDLAQRFRGLLHLEGGRLVGRTALRGPRERPAPGRRGQSERPGSLVCRSALCLGRGSADAGCPASGNPNRPYPSPALLLLAALGRVLALTEGNLAHWPTTPRINVFFDRPEPPARLHARWRAHPEIAALEEQSSEASRTEFLAALGMETALSRGLAGEAMPPLPSVVLVTPRLEAQSAARLKALAEGLSQEAGAMGVQVDLAWWNGSRPRSAFSPRCSCCSGAFTAAVVPWWAPSPAWRF